jgi:hypothetical protein
MLGIAEKHDRDLVDTERLMLKHLLERGRMEEAVAATLHPRGSSFEHGTYGRPGGKDRGGG